MANHFFLFELISRQQLFLQRLLMVCLCFYDCKNLGMNWILLIIAGLFEVGFTTCLSKAKITNGSTAMFWLAGFFISLTLSMLLLYKATQSLPMGTAYAVWTGVGAVGTAIIGILFFKEPADFWRLFFIVTLISSIAGLKYVSQ